MEVISPYASTDIAVSTVALPICASLAITILVIPFIWHFHNRNVGACALILCISLQNLFAAINAVIWPNEDYNNWWIGTGLCDVEAKLAQPLITGLSCAVVSIVRNLANALDVNHSQLSSTRASKTRKMIIDLGICFGIPTLQIILHYIVQVNRYYIGAISGCAASYDNSWPTILIMYIWPVIFTLLSCYYSVVIIVRLRRHRSQFTAILASSGSSYNTSRFLRLFIMSFSLLVIYTPVCIYFFYINVNITWISYDWNAIHDPTQWNIIIFLPALGPRTFDAWVPIVMSLFVFGYFGVGNDAIEIYKRWMRAIGLGRVFPSLDGPQIHNRHRDSTSSFMSRMSMIDRAKIYFEGHADD